jgi:hypothetical protein
MAAQGGGWTVKSELGRVPENMIQQNVAEIIENRVVLDLQGFDRIYLNAYQPLLQTPGGTASFFKQHRGFKVVGSSLMAPESEGFNKGVEQFAKRGKIERVRFEKGQCKEEIAKEHLKAYTGSEGVLFIGTAQEKCKTFRTMKKVNGTTGESYPWLYLSAVMCNQYYFYILDEDFGMLFIKFSSYFPFNGRVCLNGHEYAKRQLAKEGIEFQGLDNGFLSCANPERLQAIMDGLDAAKIEALFRKWLKRLPQAFSEKDSAAGMRYELSVLQIEIARTQVFDKPVAGRHFFEEVIRENIDLGRPDNVSLIFGRKVTKRTPSVFRTRIITNGVIPSLHASYKNSKIKQYFKEGRALRTETTINQTRDFGVGRKLANLPALREIGCKANQRMLEIEKISHDCLIGEAEFEKIVRPAVVENQRAAGLKFGDPRAMALLAALCLFNHALSGGFANKDLRKSVAQLLGEDPSTYTQGRMSYDLRRLRLHGLIERVKGSHRYKVTRSGLKASLLFTKLYERVLNPAFSPPVSDKGPLAATLRQLDNAIGQLHALARMGA